MNSSMLSLSDVGDSSDVGSVRHGTNGHLSQLIPSSQQECDDIYTESLHTLTRQAADQVEGELSESDGEPKPKYGKKTRGRVKIKMQFINNKLRRYTTFSKRKTGIMKKAYELSTLTGTQVMLLVASETGHVYTFATKKLQPMITSESGKALIQTCLNSPDSGQLTAREMENDRRMNPNGFEETELSYAVADDEDDQTNELHDSSALGTTNNQEQAAVALMMQQNTTATSNIGNTFNFNTIIPPTSNSDGTLGKATNLTMQVPHSISVQSSTANMMMTSSNTSNNPNSMSSSIESPEVQIQRQQEEIQRLQERQRQEQQLQLQIQQQQQQQQQQHENQQQSQILQQLTSSIPSSIQTQQLVLPRTPSTVIQADTNTGRGPLLYQPSPGQTVLYTPTAIGALDIQPFVNIVNAQGISTFNSSTTIPANNNPATPQYITIPVSLATNQVFQVAKPVEVGKKT